MSTPALAAAIILAAGKGTRIKNSTPKVLLEMCGRSLVGHANDAVVGAGAQNIVFVVRHERDRVVAHLQDINPTALIADQDDIKGTGRAAWCGLQALPADLVGPVLIVAGDSPMFTPQTFHALLDAHVAEGGACTVLSTRVPDAHGYGRILRAAAPGSSEIEGTAQATGPIVGIVEEKDATDLQRQITEIGTSTYIFDAQFLRDCLVSLGTDNAQGEMYLTDLIALAHDTGAGVASFVLEDSIQAEGVNDLAQLATLREEKNRRIVRNWMLSGVSIIDPKTTSIDVDVVLEPDSIIQPGTILKGKTKIHAFANVGPYSRLEDVTVARDVQVPFTEAKGVAIEETIPPFTQLIGSDE